MKTNLANAGQVPARQLAQMRLVANTAKLAPAIADAFCEGALARGLTAAQAEAVVQGVAHMAAPAFAHRVDDATLIKLTDEFLTKVTGGTQPEPQALATEILLAHLAVQDDTPVSRNPRAHQQGHSWDGPAAMASKIADARAAAIAPLLGLKHEPTIGRELGLDPLGHARVWADAQGLRIDSDVATMEAFVTGRVPGQIAYMSGSHTTSDFPSIAGSTAQLLIGRALEQAPVAVATCASKIKAQDWRDRKMANTSAASSLQQVPEGGEVKFRTLDETGETVPAPDRYAGAFRATDELIRNASTGGYSLDVAIVKALLAAAQESQRSVLAAAITANAAMADGQAVFSAAHANIAGAAAAISVASLGAARTAMQRFTDSRNAARPVIPAIILVPPEKQTEAEQLVASITAAKAADANPFAGALRVVADPGLPGTGTYHWYVLPDPGTADGLALITMDGMDTPRVEMRDAWPNFGMEWRVQWPLAAAFMRASWYRTEGA